MTSGEKQSAVPLVVQIEALYNEAAANAVSGDTEKVVKLLQQIQTELQKLKDQKISVPETLYRNIRELALNIGYSAYGAINEAQEIIQNTAASNTISIEDREKLFAAINFLRDLSQKNELTSDQIVELHNLELLLVRVISDESHATIDGWIGNLAKVVDQYQTTQQPVWRDTIIRQIQDILIEKEIVSAQISSFVITPQQMNELEQVAQIIGMNLDEIVNFNLEDKPGNQSITNQITEISTLIDLVNNEANTWSQRIQALNQSHQQQQQLTKVFASATELTTDQAQAFMELTDLVSEARDQLTREITVVARQYDRDIAQSANPDERDHLIHEYTTMVQEITANAGGYFQLDATFVAELQDKIQKLQPTTPQTTPNPQEATKALTPEEKFENRLKTLRQTITTFLQNSRKYKNGVDKKTLTPNQQDEIRQLITEFETTIEPEIQHLLAENVNQQQREYLRDNQNTLNQWVDNLRRLVEQPQVENKNNQNEMVTTLSTELVTTIKDALQRIGTIDPRTETRVLPAILPIVGGTPRPLIEYLEYLTSALERIQTLPTLTSSESTLVTTLIPVSRDTIQQLRRRVVELEENEFVQWQAEMQNPTTVPWLGEQATLRTLDLNTFANSGAVDPVLAQARTLQQNFQANVNGLPLDLQPTTVRQRDYIETRRKELQAIAQGLENRRNELQAQAAETQNLAQWQTETTQLRNAVADIERLDEKKVKPHSNDPAAKDTGQLDGYKSRLTTRYNEQRTKGNLDTGSNQRVNSEIVILVGPDKISGSYGKAQAKIDKMIELSKKEKEKSKEERARARIEQLWVNIRSNEKVTKDNPADQNSLNSEYVPSRDNIETAGILPLVREFFPDEINKWNIKINLHNGFNAAANQDVFKQFYFIDATGSRSRAPSHVDFGNMREYAKMAEIKPLFNSLNNYFESPQKYTYGTNRVTGNKELITTQDVNDYDNVVTVEHDYARDGNPNADQTAAGALTIGELLKLEHPDAWGSDIDALQYLGILGEIRLKYYTPYYADYLKTADGTFDTKVIAYHAPMAAILYRIRGYGKIPANMNLLWQILRLPGPPTNGQTEYTQALDPKINNDRKVLKRGYVPEYVPPDCPEDTHHHGPGPKHYKKIRGHGYNNHQVEEAIEVRYMRDQMLTRYYRDFEGVRLDDSLTIIPFMWDIIFDKKYGAITYKEYSDSFVKWKEFLEAAQYPADIKKPSDINDRIGGLVGKISPFKAFFGVLKEGTPEGDRFRDVLRQILFRNIKDVYDEYDKKAAVGWHEIIGKAWSKRDLFFQIVKSEIAGLGTLDASIKDYMIHKIDNYNKFGKGFFDDLFSPAKYDPLSLRENRGNLREQKRREHLVTQYTKLETAEEKAH